MSWHIGQSTHNFDTCKYLQIENPRHKDWEVTSLFYSALHLVEGYLFLIKNITPRGHKRRSNAVMAELPLIFNEYDTLFWLSIKSRYQATPNGITPDEERESIRCHHIIESYIKTELRKVGFI